MSQRSTVISESLPAGMLLELRRKVICLWEEGVRQNAKTASNDERRTRAQENMKRVAREVFLTQPTATEEDFERCWPELRDRMFLEYTLDLAAHLVRIDKDMSL